jgi:SAM-dependent methyltransferase
MKRFSPASERNKDPILDVLRDVVPATGRVLELSAGSGQHTVHFAAAFPGIVWQPSDVDEGALASVAAHREEAGLGNVLAPIRLDVTADDWGVGPVDVVLCINMIHISPWACSEGLFAGAARVLKPGGALVTYGPYNVDGAFTSDGNARFDTSLRSRDARWGIRDLADLLGLAEAVGFAREAVVDMPANNKTVIYRLQD